MQIDSSLIGIRVLSIRKELKMSRDAFGSKIGVQGAVIRNIEENNNKKINEPLLISISTQYGVNKDWLLYGSGEKYKKSNETLINDLVNFYHLSFYGEQIIKTYLELDNEKKKIIDEFIEKLVSNTTVDKTLVAARGNSNLEIVSDDDAVRKDIENYILPTDL